MTEHEEAALRAVAVIHEDMARENVELHRRVIELEEQDRERLRRIASLKLALQERSTA